MTSLYTGSVRVFTKAGIDVMPRGAACGVTRLVLYGAESGAVEMPTVLDRHRTGCLVCQAATVRQRQLIKDLGSLRDEIEPLPYDLAGALDQPMVVASAPLDQDRDARRRSLRTAVASAAAIGAVVLAGRWIRSHVN